MRGRTDLNGEETETGGDTRARGAASGAGARGADSGERPQRDHSRRAQLLCLSPLPRQVQLTHALHTCAPSPTLSPTDPVPQVPRLHYRLLTLCTRAAEDGRGPRQALACLVFVAGVANLLTWAQVWGQWSMGEASRGHLAGACLVLSLQVSPPALSPSCAYIHLLVSVP